MFFGNYSHSLDNKGRLVIPSKFRDELGNNIFIMKGFDGALAIYKKDAFNEVVEELEKYSFLKKENRDYLRIKLASIVELEVDKNGRIQIPTAILTKYSISKNVTVLGSGDHIEIWSNEKFEQYISSIEDNYEELAEKIGNDDE